MSRNVTPVEPCRSCKTKAPCTKVDPPPRMHSGWECTSCGEVRWGGVVSAGGPYIIGYTFSDGCAICWRCHRQYTQGTGANYPALPYLSGFMMGIYSDNKGPFTRCCDECGVVVNPNC